MVHSIRDVALLCCIALVISYTDADNARKKDRDVSGLYPFPRVGRRDTILDRTAQEFIKREGLIPFPRVGRGHSSFMNKRGDPEESSLWFGPRLGRGPREPEWSIIHLEEPQQKDDIANVNNDGSNLDNPESFGYKMVPL